MSSWKDQQWRPRCQRHFVRRNILRCKGESGEPCVHGVPSREDQHGKHYDSGTDTVCDATTCGENDKAVNLKCAARPPGKKPAVSTTMPLRSSYVGGNTSRYKQECGEHVRVVCPAGRTSSGDHDAFGIDAWCDATSCVQMRRGDPRRVLTALQPSTTKIKVGAPPRVDKAWRQPRSSQASVSACARNALPSQDCPVRHDTVRRPLWRLGTWFCGYRRPGGVLLAVPLPLWRFCLCGKVQQP
jgi:hypothetical protein